MAKRTDDLFDFTGAFGELFDGWRTYGEKVVKRAEAQPLGLRSYRTSSDKDGMTLEVDLPGVATKDVVLWASDNQVIVEAQRGEQKFTNRYTIDERYDPHTATASMAHGLLKVRIKLAPDRKTRRIDIVQG